jgi:hypothetical protein
MLLCFFASCAVYDPSVLGGGTGGMNGGASGTFNVAGGGRETAGAGRGGMGATSAIGDAGTSGDMSLGGTETGSSGAAGSPDGGAADGGSGVVSAGSGGSAGGGGGGGVNGGGGSGGNGGTAGSPPKIIDLSSKKPATASSQQTGHEAGDGNDVDGATRWCASGATFPQWWRVDLGATHSLEEFEISFEYPDRKYYYDIETSANDSAYTLQVRASGTAAVQSGVFPDGVSARYVRITVTNADPGPMFPTWASFFEFVVSGT